MVLWTVAVLGLIVAAAALWVARRLGRRLDALTQSYWELRYDYTRLRSQVARLDPATPSEPEPVPQAPAGDPVSFVPLASMRKKDR